MKKILIALDYNHAGEKVAETGYELARTAHADIILAHVMTDPAYYAIGYSPIMGYTGAYTDGTVAVVNDLKKEAWKFLAAAARHLGNEKIKTKVLEGDIETAIIDYGKNCDADLIVLGSHSHKGFDRLFVTDVAAQVLRHSTIPVFIIPTMKDLN